MGLASLQLLIGGSAPDTQARLPRGIFAKMMQGDLQ